MSLENVQEESAAERSPAALRVGVGCLAAAHKEDLDGVARCECAHYAGGLWEPRRSVVAFKFGGSSLLVADPWLPSSGLYCVLTRASTSTLVESSVKGVTHPLPSTSH